MAGARAVCSQITLLADGCPKTGDVVNVTIECARSAGFSLSAPEIEPAGIAASDDVGIRAVLGLKI